MKKKLFILPLLALSVGVLSGCTKDDLAAYQTQNDEDISALKAKDDDLQSQIDQLKNDVNGMKSQITALQTEMNTKVQEAKDDYDAKVNAINAKITQDEAALTSLTNSFNSDKAALQADYEAKIKAVDDKYAPLMETANAKIAALETNLANAQQAFTNQINALVAADTSLGNRITALEGDLEDAFIEINDAIGEVQAQLAEDEEAIGEMFEAVSENLSSLATSIQALYDGMSQFGNWLIGEDLDNLFYCFAYAVSYGEYYTDQVASDLAELQEYVDSLGEEAGGAINELYESLSELASFVSEFYADYQAQMEDLAETLDGMDASIGELADDLLNVADAIDVERERIDELVELEAADKAELQQALQDAVADLEDALSAEAEALQAEIDELNLQLEALSDDLYDTINYLNAYYQSDINYIVDNLGGLLDIPVCRVTFAPNYENIDGTRPELIVKNVLKGDKVEAPVIEREGFELESWCLDANPDQPWVFYGYVVTEDMYLYAQWQFNGVHEVDYLHPVVLEEATLEHEGITRYQYVGANAFVEISDYAPEFYVSIVDYPDSAHSTLYGTLQHGILRVGDTVAIQLYGSDSSRIVYDQIESIFNFRDGYVDYALANERDEIQLTFKDYGEAANYAPSGALVCLPEQQIYSKTFYGTFYCEKPVDTSSTSFVLPDLNGLYRSAYITVDEGDPNLVMGESREAELNLKFDSEYTFIRKGTRLEVENSGTTFGYFEVEDYSILSFFEYQLRNYNTDDFDGYEFAPIAGAYVDGSDEQAFAMSGMASFANGIDAMYKPNDDFYDLHKPLARDFENWDAVYGVDEYAYSDHSKVFTVFYEYYDNLVYANLGQSVQYFVSGSERYFVFRLAQPMELDCENIFRMLIVTNDAHMDCNFKTIYSFVDTGSQLVKGEQLSSTVGVEGYIGLYMANGSWPNNPSEIRAMFLVTE